MQKKTSNMMECFFLLPTRFGVLSYFAVALVLLKASQVSSSSSSFHDTRQTVAFVHLWKRQHPSRQQSAPTGTTAVFSITQSNIGLPKPSPAPVDTVQIYADANEVSAAVREIVQTTAQQALKERGHFALAIPGGSILKMLVGTDTQCSNGDQNWTSKMTMAYVNHKCVAMDDSQAATHAKACALFLQDWITEGCNVITMDGTNDGLKEASTYQAKLEALSPDVLPRDEKSGLPLFDLALIGVGDDGHIGSLYPNREEVLVGASTSNNDEKAPWVLSVDMKDPPSITLSLPVMQNAKKVIVAACGVSDKYPQGKSAGMQRAIANPEETLSSFPAVGLRSKATWILDHAAASKLGPVYIRP